MTLFLTPTANMPCLHFIFVFLTPLTFCSVIMTSLIFLFFLGCHQKTETVIKFAETVPIKYFDDLGALFQFYEQSIPQSCDTLWSLSAEESSKIVKQFHTDYSAALRFLHSQSLISQEIVKEARIRRLVSRFHVILTKMRSQIAQGNTKVPVHFIVILTACRCLRLASLVPSPTSREFFLRRTVNMFTTKREVLKKSPEFKVTTHEDVQLLQTYDFLKACRAKHCVALANAVMPIIHDPDRLPAATQIINSFIFGDIPESDHIMDDWIQNILPKLQQLNHV